MKQRMTVGGLVFALAFYLIGCGSDPSLTDAELEKQYPDKKYVQIDGVSLHYEQTGLGRPLVLLHGFPTSSHVWRNIIPGLTYGTTVYSLDLMGFGVSEKPQDVTYSLETYVAQLGAFLDTLHLENPILVGQEIGASIVALYTIRNPGKVHKLILMNAPFYDRSPPFSIRLLSIPLLGELLTGDWFLKRILRGGMENQDKMTPALLSDYLQPYHDDPGARTTLLKFVREFETQSLLEDEIQPGFSKLQLPTLLVWGAHDPYVPLHFGRQLDRTLPNARLKVILRSGHYIQEERPEEVRAAVKEFIDE